MLEGIAAATITALAAIIVAVYQGRSTRRQNSEEHAEGRQLLREAIDGIDTVAHKVDGIRDDLDAHLADHHQEEQ